MGLITTSFVQIFLPFSANFDLFVASFSVLIFSGFVLYDTQQIMTRLSVDEAILVSHSTLSSTSFDRANLLREPCRCTSIS
jgi:FtsH-binding integral membrane protein